MEKAFFGWRIWALFGADLGLRFFLALRITVYGNDLADTSAIIRHGRGGFVALVCQYRILLSTLARGTTHRPSKGPRYIDDPLNCVFIGS